MNNWQAMLTAPKDGTHILMCVRDTDDRRKITEGYWETSFDRWEVIWLDVHGCGCCGGGRVDPEGWMPLPEFPQ